MANEFEHITTGVDLSQAEYEGILAHKFDGQATGDIMYASSNVQLSRRAIGAGNTILSSQGGVPVWRTPTNILADLSGQAGAEFLFNTKKVGGVVDPTTNQQVATKKYHDDNTYTNAEAVAAAEAAGLALASGKNIKVIANLTGDQTWSGITAVLQAGEIITRTELCYVKNDGKMWLAQSDAAGTMPAIAVFTGANLAANAWGEFLLLGFYREDTILTFALGDMLYVSDTVAGAFDNVLPSDAGEQVQVLGKCLIGTHIIYFNPSLELVEIG